MFYLENLASVKILTGVNPWEFKSDRIPEAIRLDKALRDTWITNPETKHHVYTFDEGLNAGIRISPPKKDGEGNPVQAMWALVADYDSATPKEKILEYAKSLAYAPNYIERTLSGNWRFVWLFEEKLIMPSHDFSIHFRKTILKEFRLDLGAPGFDKGAFLDPCRLYTNSCEWIIEGLRPSPLPKELLMGWMVKASQTFKWDDREVGAIIPLDVVKEALKEKYPRFATFPDFVLGAQGPSFWIDGSTSPKSAIVRETGIQTFSSHAVKGFYTWQDLLGEAFVKDYQATAIGKAVEGIYTNGKQYWWENPNGVWIPNEKSDLFNHLKIDRNVSLRPDKEGKNDAERCLGYIRAHHYLAAVGPFVMRPSGIFEKDGERCLNILKRKVMTPAEGKAVWGDNGQFPWLSLYLDVLFDPHSPQREVFISWFKVLYVAVYRCIPQKGQALVIAGGVGVGKTFLGSRVIGAAVGGSVDASGFLEGGENFNSAMLSAPLLCSDDSTSATSRQTHQLFSEIVKKMTANRGFLYKEKYVKESMVEWFGRVFITCNSDEESVRKLPNLDISILDKLIILKAAEMAGIKFPPGPELDAILDRELPWLCRYLLDYEIPAELLGDSRYVIKPYCEPSLLATAQQSSATSAFQEILEDFLKEFFGVKNQKAEFWEGSSLQLHKSILSDPSVESAMRPFGVDSVGRHLSQLKNKGAKIEALRTNSARVWRIFPDAFQNVSKKNQ